MLLVAHAEDEALATAVHTLLHEEHGLEVFYDEKSIPWGSSIFDEQTNAADRSNKVLILVSGDFLADTAFARDVIGVARERSSKILPILLDSITAKEFGEKQCLLAQRQALSASRHDVEALAEDVARYLQSKRSQCSRH